MLNEGQVRDLCERVAQERDAQKAAEMLRSIQQMISMETDETRLRIRQILLHYREQPSTLKEKPKNSISQFVAALIAGTRQDPSHRN